MGGFGTIFFYPFYLIRKLTSKQLVNFIHSVRWNMKLLWWRIIDFINGV